MRDLLAMPLEPIEERLWVQMKNRIRTLRQDAEQADGKAWDDEDDPVVLVIDGFEATALFAVRLRTLDEWMENRVSQKARAREPENVRALRARVSLEAVIGETVALTRRYNSGVGVCPLCPRPAEEPSLSVSDRRGFFHCFHCGEHGDVFDWVSKVRGVTFTEAVEVVAARWGAR